MTELTALDQLEQGLFIGGTWSALGGGEAIEVICPSTEDRVGRVGAASNADVDAAVSAAREAFESGQWPHTSPEERADVIDRAAGLLRPRVEEIARLVTTEMGAPISMTTATVTRALDLMGFLAGLARETSLVELRREGGFAAVVREPVGVVGGIAPWNGPFSMAVAKIVPALLAGCTVVFKPAPETPFDVAPLVDALHEAGVPHGAVNVVTGADATGRALVRGRVDKISFTGSSAVGREIGEVCGRDFKRIQLELGGKSAAIVLEDADLEQVRASLAVGCFMNSGQVCASLSRVLAPCSMYEDVVRCVAEAATGWRVGDPFDPETTMGPLVSGKQRERVEGYVEAGRQEGARLVTGGGRPEGLTEGFYVEPTVFRDVDNSMRIAREEIFGPVACVIPFEDEGDAVRIANDSEYGLHGAVFTEDADRAWSVARQVRTGTFSVNSFAYNNRVPFGGVKGSGVGRDTGREGFESFFELKTINLPAGNESVAEKQAKGATE